MEEMTVSMEEPVQGRNVATPNTHFPREEGDTAHKSPSAEITIGAPAITVNDRPKRDLKRQAYFRGL